MNRVSWMIKTAFVILALSVPAGAFFGWDYFLHADRFLVRNVQFEGEFRHVARRQLSDAVAEQVQGNVFLLDLDAVKARVESVPWVHRASVRRQWPPGVLIQFSEQKMVGQWQGGNQAAWVNGDGELVDLHGQDLPQGLPVLQGPAGAQVQVMNHYLQLSEMLAPLNLKIAGLQLSPRRTWRMDLDNGLTLILGHGAPEEKIDRFVQSYPEIFAKYSGQIKQADFRYTNGFSVQWVNPARAASGLRSKG